MKFYAFEYLSARTTTTGQPNPRTGLRSIAGVFAVFTSRADRDAWVGAGRITSDMSGNCRQALTAKDARRHRLGLSLEEYEVTVKILTDVYSD